MYFRNKKFDKAFKYLNTMKLQMEKRNGKFRNNFILKYNNLLALCNNYTDNINMAIKIAENVSSIKHPDTESLLDINLCLCMFYFQNNNYNKALKKINSFYHSDIWYEQKTSKEWVAKKSLIEILIHIELDNINLVTSRILSFKRKYFSHLKKTNQIRIVTFINLI